MPSPALFQPSPTLTSVTPQTILLSGTQTLTSAGGNATIVVFSSHHQGTWTAWNEDYSTTSVTASPVVRVQAITDGGTSGGTASDRIWVRWNQEYTTSVTATGTAEVTVATAHGSATTVTIDPWPAWNATYVRERRNSDEEYQAQLRRSQEQQRERERRWQAERAEREQADQRANVLLREALTPEQQAELADKQYFTLRTVRPNGEERIYRIHRGRSHNIERVDASGRRMQRYCMHPVIDCPDADTMLAQKLWLQNPDLEDELLRRANRS